MRAHADTNPPVLGVLRHACRFCSLHELCGPLGLEPGDLERLQSIVRRTDRLPAGSYLYRVGDKSTAIFALRSGCIKSFTLDAGGNEVVYGFHLPGELLGFDAIYPDRRQCNALMLESSSLCIIPYHDIVSLGVDCPGLHSQILRLMGREISKQRMHRKGHGAAQRTALFLLEVYSRMYRPGSVEFEFRLPMSREDISNHLHYSPETLSRQLTKFHRNGLIKVDGRQVRFMDSVRLDMIAQGID